MENFTGNNHGPLRKNKKAFKVPEFEEDKNYLTPLEKLQKELYDLEEEMIAMDNILSADSKSALTLPEGANEETYIDDLLEKMKTAEKRYKELRSEIENEKESEKFLEEIKKNLN